MIDNEELALEIMPFNDTGQGIRMSNAAQTALLGVMTVFGVTFESTQDWFNFVRFLEFSPDPEARELIELFEELVSDPRRFFRESDFEGLGFDGYLSFDPYWDWTAPVNDFAWMFVDFIEDTVGTGGLLPWGARAIELLGHIVGHVVAEIRYPGWRLAYYYNPTGEIPIPGFLDGHPIFSIHDIRRVMPNSFAHIGTVGYSQIVGMMNTFVGAGRNPLTVQGSTFREQRVGNAIVTTRNGSEIHRHGNIYETRTGFLLFQNNSNPANSIHALTVDFIEPSPDRDSVFLSLPSPSSLTASNRVGSGNQRQSPNFSARTSPANIFDNPNQVFYIINNITNGVNVYIKFPPDIRDLLNREREDIIRPLDPPDIIDPTDPIDPDDPCPIDPIYPCLCPPNIEDLIIYLIQYHAIPCPINPEDLCQCPDPAELDARIIELIEEHAPQQFLPCPIDPEDLCNCPEDFEEVIREVIEDIFTYDGDSDDGSSGGIFWPIVRAINNLLSTLLGLTTTLLETILELFSYTFNFAEMFSVNLYSITDHLPNFMEYFPFSMPFALYNTVRVIAGQAPVEIIGMTPAETRALLESYNYLGIDPHSWRQAPRIEIEFPPPFNYTFVFDMNDYPIFINLVRWSSLVTFTFAMLKITPKMLRI